MCVFHLMSWRTAVTLSQCWPRRPYQSAEQVVGFVQRPQKKSRGVWRQCELRPSTTWYTLRFSRFKATSSDTSLIMLPSLVPDNLDIHSCLAINVHTYSMYWYIDVVISLCLAKSELCMRKVDNFAWVTSWLANREITVYSRTSHLYLIKLQTLTLYSGTLANLTLGSSLWGYTWPLDVKLWTLYTIPIHLLVTQITPDFLQTPSSRL